MARIISLIVLIIEIVALTGNMRKRKWDTFMYYTQLSNMMCAVSSLALVVFGQKEAVGVLRYVSVCMLTMTVFVTCFVLIPLGGSAKDLLFSRGGFPVHVLCPVLSVSSYLFAEYHAGSKWIILPVLLTIIYAIIMLCLNRASKIRGPYPFFMIRENSRRMTVISIAGLLAVTVVISLAFGYRKEKETELKFIYVHGLAGWGSYDPLYEFYPYWGLAGGDIIRYMNNLGYDSYAASVDPMGSSWDRACELYAQLKGCRVDYGEEHSRRCNHERFGRDYTGHALVSNFDDSEFVLIGHSFGGATIRLFSEILRNGSPEELEISGDSASDYFKGGHGDGLFAVVTLAAPTNGTTSYDLYDDPDYDITAIDIPADYIEKGKKVSEESKAEEDGRIEEDYASFDMHIDNALALNERLTTFDDVYYFALPFTSCITDGSGGVTPDPSITEAYFMKNAILMSRYTGHTAKGFEIDETWQENDGLVNTISAGAPFGTESSEFSEGVEPVPGIWYVFPPFRGDHMSPQGGFTHWVNVKPYYRKLMEMLVSLEG